jgi:hypothetical protein
MPCWKERVKKGLPPDPEKEKVCPDKQAITPKKKEPVPA